ncbi:hypothetical protein ACGFXB_46010 [Streptomyces canus]|uniref:hypothetical protein n=1 Tax=Streptomyces canus TaxID=58343 RepID=UPI0037186CE2
MPLIALFASVFVVTIELTVEQFSQWKYGYVGLIALLLLTLGLKYRNSTCSTVGAVMLALLVMRPAM